jgi:hypothetical protein
VLAPDALSDDDWPIHIVAGEAVAVTVGKGLTVNVTVAVLVHPEVVPVTVYVVVAPGAAVTDAPVVTLKPVLGAHV